MFGDQKFEELIFVFELVRSCFDFMLFQYGVSLSCYYYSVFDLCVSHAATVLFGPLFLRVLGNMTS